MTTQAKVTPTVEDLRGLLAKPLQACGAIEAVLFGSVATGHAHEDSDVDLLVVVAHSDKPAWDRQQDLQAVTDACPYPVDIFVYTPEELRRVIEERRRFAVQALAEGVVIYKKGGTSMAFRGPRSSRASLRRRASTRRRSPASGWSEPRRTSG